MQPIKTELASIDAITLTNLPCHFEKNGGIVVIEGSVNVPFNIARVFTITAPVGAIRGQHAHRDCSQFLTCPTGIVEVLCDDGEKTITYILDHPKLGLFLPKSIWAQQTYLAPNTVLNVLCDRPYESQDYIRDYEQFKIYRR